MHTPHFVLGAGCAYGLARAWRGREHSTDPVSALADGAPLVARLRALEETVGALRERARLAEAEAAACRIDVSTAEMTREAALARLHEATEAYERSLSWRMTRPLRRLHDGARRLLSRNRDALPNASSSASCGSSR